MRVFAKRNLANFGRRFLTFFCCSGGLYRQSVVCRLDPFETRGVQILMTSVGLPTLRLASGRGKHGVSDTWSL